MNAVFLKILNMSITAGWLILAVILVRMVLKKAPKWISCLLWGLVAVRLICPFSFESVLSLIPSSETIPADIALQPRPAIESGISFVNETVNPILQGSLSPRPAQGINPLAVIIPIAAIVWAVGVAGMLAYALISYLRLKKSVSACVEIKDRIYSGDGIKAPFILGVFRPRIYVPSSMDESALQYVIRHEEAHIMRRDHWWKPFGFILLAVYWFHPLSWAAYALLSRDIEIACDEKVVRRMDSNDRAAYSQVLLNCSFPSKRIAACPLSFGEVGVKQRVKNVLNYKKPAFWIIVIALVLCAALAVFLMTNPFSGKKMLAIRYDLGTAAKDFTYLPDEARAGDTVEIRTDVLYDADLHVYVDGQEIEKTHYDSDYWGYTFMMPEKEVLVTARFYSKDEIWGVDMEALKKKFPNYFGLSAENGLDVYVWEVVPHTFRCRLRERNESVDESNTLQLMQSPDASCAEMRAILSTYNVGKGDIRVIPWQNPVSDFLSEYYITWQGETPEDAEARRQEYLIRIQSQLFGN